MVFQSLRWIFVGCALALALIALPASAHRIDESYIYFQVTDEDLTGRFEVTAKDLAQVFTFEGADGPPSNDQIAARADEIFAYLADRLTLLSQGQSYAIAPTGVDFLETDIATFALFSFAVPELGATPETIDLSYDFLFADIDPNHLGYALIESNSRTGVWKNESHISLTFAPGMGPQTLNLVGEPLGDVFAAFVLHGIWHIWLGFDHLLFLASLLVTAAMVLQGTHWAPSPNPRQSLINMIGLITIFTLAHAFTLSLAAFGVVRLPSLLVEGVIALSIALVALGNLVPSLYTRSWIVVFVYGFFHGFGYVGVMAPLGADPTTKAVGLTAFSIGIEIGQLAIVLAAFPILYALRNWRPYPFLALRMGSVALIAVAVLWFVERTYNVLGPVRQTLISLVS